jgi:hypothetical protein
MESWDRIYSTGVRAFRSGINCLNLALERCVSPKLREPWVIADLIGKAGHVRTIPIPGWVKVAIDDWKEASGIKRGSTFSLDK